MIDLNVRPILVNSHYFEDNRGELRRVFCADQAKSLTRSIGYFGYIHDVNYVVSSQNILRGMHWQRGLSTVHKVISCVSGEIQDVVIDLRPHSPKQFTYYSFKLNGGKPQQLHVPKGFAHGFLTLSPTATVIYAIGGVGYDRINERSLAYNDPTVGIQWEIPTEQIILSDKDKAAPTIEKLTDSDLTFF